MNWLKNLCYKTAWQSWRARDARRKAHIAELTDLINFAQKRLNEEREKVEEMRALLEETYEEGTYNYDPHGRTFRNIEAYLEKLK